jgi:N-acetylglucosamine-6-phosphate deacetylase
MTNALLIKNAQVMTPTARWHQGWLLTHDRKIALMGQGDAPNFEDAQTIDASGRILLPGFIDVHVHGGVGHEMMDATPEAVRALTRFYAQNGVTGFLPSTWTESREKITAALEVVAELQGPQPDGATILGVHLEGPYLNLAKVGAQNPAFVRRSDREEALAFLDTKVIRLLALAPEFPENHWLIQECVRRGVTVSAAHTASTYEDIRHAASLGLTHSTHTFNAMVGLGHREPGTIGAVLTMPEIYCELIADTIHVHPAAMQILFAAKGADRVILITDAVRGAGMGDTSYVMYGMTVMVKDGAVRLPDGTLAGSAATMNRCLHNFMQATGQPLHKIWQCSSLNAARSLNISDRKGSLEVGKDADLVLVDEQINVYMTIAEGNIVYRK